MAWPLTRHPPDAGATPDDDMKAKFREALARKQGRHTGGGEGHADAAGKASHTAGPAAHQKEFRRKAGG